MGAVKRKEQDYLEKLGKSHENLRMERDKNRDLQGQNEFYQKTLTILETTIAQVKSDKMLYEEENRRLKEFLTAKDLVIDREHYQKVMVKQHDSLGRDSVQEMDKRSKSLGMRSSIEKHSRNDASLISRPSTRQKRYDSNSSLVERHIERSTERKPANKRRASSQMSNHINGEFNLMSQFPTDGVTVGGGLLEGHSPLRSKEGSPGRHYQTDQYVNPPRPTDFRTRESKETGRFIEPLTMQDRLLVDERIKECHDPRINRLLHDAKNLQQKHEKLASQSPLRLRDHCAERMGIRSSSPSRCPSGAKASMDRAKQVNYHRMPEDPQIIDRQSSPAYEQFDRSKSPLRLKRCQDGGQSTGIGPTPEQEHIRAVSASLISESKQPFDNYRPSGESTVRPYYEPPSQSTRRSGEPVQQVNNYLPTLQEEPMLEPIRDALSANEIREAAGIANPCYRNPSPDRVGNLKSLVNNARLAHSRGRRPHFADDPTDLQLGHLSKSQGADNNRRKHDNEDYIQMRKEREDSGARPEPIVPVIDKGKLEDQYNQKLLDDIERLAEKARNKSNPGRENNFKRGSQNGGPNSSYKSNKENSPFGSSKSAPNVRLSANSQRSNQQPLPKSIFGKPVQDEDDSREAYQNKLRQMQRSENSNEPTRRVPSNNPRGRSRRPLSQEEDEYETTQMLVQPKRGAAWTNGINRRNSIEREKPTAANNSFLARREALQNRLKKA